MDPKTGLPVIKPEVNKEKERKKGAGFFARLFGAAEAGGGLGGTAVDIGGAAAGGGLLATKAGLIALLLAGSTVAAGIGLVGYRLFGPGADSTDNNYSLFAPRPKNQAGAAGAGAAQDAEGTSKSLSMLNQGNPDLTNPSGGAGDQAPKDQNAAGASAAGGAANSANGGTAMSDSGPNGVHPMSASKLPPLAGFGSAGGAAGGGGSSSASGGTANKFDASASKGGLTAMSTKSGAAARSSMASARAGHSNGALGQAFGALGNQAGGHASSSYAAGRTYDGSATTGASSIGPGAGAPGISGTDGTGQTSAKSTPNTAIGSNQIQPPPTPAATEVTPWKGDIQAAQVLIALAVVLMLVKKMLAKSMMSKTFTLGSAEKILDGIIAAIGLAVIAIGARVSGGQYGQVLQGQVLAAAGAGIMIASLGSMAMFDDSTEVASTTPPSTTATATGGGGNILSGLNPFIILGGGVSLVALAASALQPPKSYPSTDFNNGLAPGQSWFSQNGMPSEHALERYLS
jgi:hypothetical protein